MVQCVVVGCRTDPATEFVVPLRQRPAAANAALSLDWKSPRLRPFGLAFTPRGALRSDPLKASCDDLSRERIRPAPSPAGETKRTPETVATWRLECEGRRITTSQKLADGLLYLPATASRQAMPSHTKASDGWRPRDSREHGQPYRFFALTRRTAAFWISGHACRVRRTIADGDRAPSPYSATSAYAA